MDLPHSVHFAPVPSLTPLVPELVARATDSSSSINSSIGMTVMTQPELNDRSRVRLWIKYSLFGFNTVLWVISIAMAGVGAWAVAQKATVNMYKAANIPFDPAVAFLVVGTVVFIISFTGCIGALRENVTLLNIYVALISMIFVLEIVLLTLTLVYKNWMYNKVKENLTSMIALYREDADLQSVIDWIQEYWLQCCGIDGPHDWESNPYFNCSSPGREACGVPHSCCITQEMKSLRNLQCGYDVRKDSEPKTTIYNEGCLEKLQMWMSDNQMPLLITSSIILTIQMSAVILGLLHRDDVRATLRLWNDPVYQTQEQTLL